MKIKYKNTHIEATQTYNKNIMRYKYQKLYYAIIIYDCNQYSSIASKQRTDILMVDNEFNILSFLLDMHENTIYENKYAKHTILLPKNYIKDLEINTKLEIIRG